MILLYGVRFEYDQNRIDGDFEEREVRDLLATFDTMEMVNDYIRAAKLKNPSNRTCFHPPKSFKKKSLLGNYDTWEIEEQEEVVSPPHNPKL